MAKKEITAAEAVARAQQSLVDAERERIEAAGRVAFDLDGLSPEDCVRELRGDVSAKRLAFLMWCFPDDPPCSLKDFLALLKPPDGCGEEHRGRGCSRCEAQNAMEMAEWIVARLDRA